jgi:hypothetical protein
MPSKSHIIIKDDLLAMVDYAARRKNLRKQAITSKRHRHMEVGPHASFYFENYETMWYQIHEMLYIEKGGDEQIANELDAYNPLIPNGRELVATLMFEIDNPVRREHILAHLGGVEEMITLSIGAYTINAQPEIDMERSTAEGKASSVHFVHFGFSEEQIKAFKSSTEPVLLMINKETYQHMAVMPDLVRQTLAADFD